MTKTAFLSALMILLCGCNTSLFNSTAMEARVVQQFADAVTEENESALRLITSTRFEEKAMSSDDALTDLRVVNLPTGELSVVEVDESEKDLRKVVVKEEAGTKYQIQLVRDQDKGYWVVDDIITRQNNRGTRVARSTLEVMDLMMTLRQFLDVWKDGSRDEILTMTSPELTEALSPLPDEWLTALTGRIASVYEDGMARKPEANLTDDSAVVKLPARNGHLLMKIVRSENGWLVDDVELHKRRDDGHPGSIQRQAHAINSVNAFLTAYRSRDRDVLKEVTDGELYESSLSSADLSLVRLADPSDVPAEFDIRAYEDRLTFMIPHDGEILRMDLRERTADEREDEAGTRFVVNEVILYNKSTQGQRSLSSVFTAPSRAAIFLKALEEGNHEMLRFMSTQEFSKGTWNRISPELLPGLHRPVFRTAGMEMVESQTLGSRTDLQFRDKQGKTITCRMTTHSSGLKVEDVQYPDSNGQVISLKTQLNLQIPVLEFVNAWQRGDFALLQKASSSEFNRLVWTHLDGVPNNYPAIVRQLSAPIEDAHVTQERATVKLQNTSDGSTTVRLVMEHDYWVVDELTTESADGRMTVVRDDLRRRIARQLQGQSFSVRHEAGGVARISTVGSVPQKPVSSGLTRHNGGVTRAVHSSDPTEDSRVQSALHTFDSLVDDRHSMSRQGAAASDSGIEVFGPEADRISREYSGGTRRPQSRMSLGTPIDMTEDATPLSGSASVRRTVASPPLSSGTGVDPAQGMKQAAVVDRTPVSTQPVPDDPKTRARKDEPPKAGIGSVRDATPEEEAELLGESFDVFGPGIETLPKRRPRRMSPPREEDLQYFGPNQSTLNRGAAAKQAISSGSASHREPLDSTIVSE